MADEKPLLLTLAADIDYYVHELLASERFMKRVHFADHLQGTWFQMVKEIEHFVKTGKPELIEEKPAKKFASPKRAKLRALDAPHEDHAKVKPDEHQSRFRDRTMAAGAAILLAEHGKLHGSDIERLLKEGGYRSKSKFFQNVLDSTFKRDGRFRNVGGNTWELKAPPLFANGNAEVERAEHKEA
jgi:hypothetical protein